MDHSAPLPPIILLLPLLQPPDHFEQRALGGGCVPVGRPADVLQVLDYPVPILRLRTERPSGLFFQGHKPFTGPGAAAPERELHRHGDILLFLPSCIWILLPRRPCTSFLPGKLLVSKTQMSLSLGRAFPDSTRQNSSLPPRFMCQNIDHLPTGQGTEGRDGVLGPWEAQ